MKLSSSNRVVPGTNAYIRHPKYKPIVRGYDIAMVRTRNKIQFNRFVQPVTLPTADTAADVPVTIAGWGMLGPHNIFLPDHLRYLDSSTISPAKCKRQFPNVAEDFEKFVCHFTAYGGACMSDSGECLVAAGAGSFGYLAGDW